jgi:hypothetical protein
MKTKLIRIPLLATAALLLSAGAVGAEPAASAKEPVAQRDGSGDFDFLIGTWKAHLRRLTKPLSGSNTWVELDGKVTVRKILGGPANADEMVVTDPATGTQIKSFTFRMYDAETRDWRIYWARTTHGAIGLPVVGRFRNGRGEFYSQEDFQGKNIFVRYAWHDITESEAHFEQAFSTDGGRTWEPNWITTFTRESK